MKVLPIVFMLAQEAWFLAIVRGVATPGLCGSGQQQQSRVDVDFEGVTEDDISGKNN